MRVGTGVDRTALRRTFGCFPTGVAAICGSVDGEPIGLVVSSFVSVSLAPPLVSICLTNDSRTWIRLRLAGRVGISVLSERHEAVCQQLATAAAPDRFAGIGWEASPGGAVFVEESAAYLECTISEEVSAGDHHIVLLYVHDVRAEPDIAPLVFHGSRFRRLGPELAGTRMPLGHEPLTLGRLVVGDAEQPDGSSRALDHILQVVAAGSSS